MINVFNLNSLKQLVDEKDDVSAIVLVDTNIVIREPDFMTWEMPIREPIFVLPDIIILELERVKNKPDSKENARKAIRNLQNLFQQGSITHGIHLENIGWFISIPTQKQEELKSQLVVMEDVSGVFGQSDTKLILLAKECANTITRIPTVFATGDINLFNIVEVYDITAYSFTHFPMDGFERIMNKYLLKVPNWDNVLADIQETTKYKLPTSFDLLQWFYSDGLMNLIMSKSPMFPRSKRIELTFVSVELREARLDEESCKEMKSTYSCPLYVKARILIREIGEIKEQDLFFCWIPMVTRDGAFIINGKRQMLLSNFVDYLPLERKLLDMVLDNIKNKAIKRMSRVSLERVTPSYLIDPKSFMESINDCFAISLGLSSFNQ